MEKLGPNQEFKFFADYQPEYFTPGEKEILEPFFSNVDRPVFVVNNLPPAVVGALIGRHSQSFHSMRLVFVEEFIKNRRAFFEYQIKLEGQKDFLDIEKAESFLEKNFVRCGHDSLAATIPLVLGFERVSQLGAKGIEDTRIGLSPIERSTRYGFFGKKKEGRYLYARSPVIMTSQHARIYEEAIDNSLDLYAQLQEPVAGAYRKKFPAADERKIVGMTYDATRVLLVAANLTNLGAMGNGQAAEHMIIKLKASQLMEQRELGEMAEEEIGRSDPAVVKRISSDFGQQMIIYLAERGKASRMLTEEFLKEIKPEKLKPGLVLTDYDPKGEDKVVAKILWPGCNLSDHQVLKAVRRFSEENKMRIIDQYLGQRPDRRAKPGRAFEEAILSFRIVCRFAEWRDLQRHRILTPHWRLLDYSLGVDIGDDLVEFGYGKMVKEKLERLAEVHSIIAQEHPAEAQYMVAFGALVPYLVTLNFRELVHIAELRTESGAHKGYARTTSEMAKQSGKAYPLLARAFQFVHWR